MAWNLCKYGTGGTPGPVIPDGKTVIPINDVEIWQKCAGLTSVYSTLAEVLADDYILWTVLTNANATDYLKRSTAFAQSTALIPTMTSDTTPSGECLARDYENAGTGIYKAFDNNLVDSHWYSKWQVNPAGNYIGYHFTESVVVNRAIYDTTDLTSTAYCPHNVKVQGSNDNSTWTDLASDSWTQAYGRHVVDFNNTTAYEYYRFYIVDGYSSQQVGATEVQFYSASITTSENAMKYIGAYDYASDELLSDSTWCNAICSSEYAEEVLNTKVPTMTSNTTPEGEVVFDSATSIYPPYYAFDGNDDTPCTTANDSPTLHYFGYAFVEPVKIYFAEWIPRDDRKTRTKVRASADGSTWTDMTDFIADDLTTKQKYSTVLENLATYRYWCCQGNVTDGNGYGMIYFTIQFYGRQAAGIQTWLQAADITDKRYTTLSQVLADSTTLAALMASQDAVDYLVTVKSWISDICSSQTAMNYIGLNNYAANTLLADSDWLNGICTSTYFESVLNVKVPVMTSNTTPSGECFGSSYYSGSDYYKAFDSNTSTAWESSATEQSPNYSSVSYSFTEAKNIYAICISPRKDKTSEYKFEASSDKATWNEIYPNTQFSTNIERQFLLLPSAVNYRHFRAYGRITTSGNYHNAMYELQFYGRADI